MAKHTGWLFRSMQALCLLVCAGCRMSDSIGPSTAFFYGKPIPASLLARYQRVVVEEANLPDDAIIRKSKADLYIYISIGEAERWRSGYEDIASGWSLGVNTHWGGDIMDLTQAGWRNFLLEKRFTPLWRRGYKRFFLDTLDSYRSVLHEEKDLQAQKQALIDFIQLLHTRFPGIKLMLNRGFEILPQVHALTDAVVAESLYFSWSPVTKRYTEVSEKDRKWLMEQLTKIKRQYGLQVVVIDYMPEGNRELAVRHAKLIAKLGFTPWITQPTLDKIGIGAKEI